MTKYFKHNGVCDILFVGVIKIFGHRDEVIKVAVSTMLCPNKSVGLEVPGACKEIREMGFVLADTVTRIDPEITKTMYRMQSP
jgi:uncharacterized protein YbbK (DUF523 family)